MRTEQDELDVLVTGLPAAEWRRPTPAEGWTIADTIHHLAVSALGAVRRGRDYREPLDGGPVDGTARVEGPTVDWCRVVTQRLRKPSQSRLSAQGDLAVAAVRVARAFL